MVVDKTEELRYTLKKLKIVFCNNIKKFVEVRVENTPAQGGAVGSVMFFENSFLYSVNQNVTPS